MIKEISFFIFFSIVFAEKLFLMDYCDPMYCYDNSKHTACNNTGQFATRCPSNIRVVKLTTDQKIFITNLHNYYRAFLANGSIQNKFGDSFPTAANMNLLEWDDEQAFMASLQLKTCLSHDSCHNSVTDPEWGDIMISGQNIAVFFTNSPFRDSIENYLNYAVFAWFIEFRDTRVDVVDAAYLAPGPATGHFIQMSHDINTGVGCAMVQWEIPYTKNDLVNKFTRITCNYRKSPYGGEPLYAVGEMGSGCAFKDNGCNFYGLCLKWNVTGCV